MVMVMVVPETGLISIELGNTILRSCTLHLGIAQIAIRPPRTRPGTMGHFFLGHILPLGRVGQFFS